MRKVKHYLGIDFSTKESTEKTNQGTKEFIENIKNQLFEMVNEYKIEKKPIIGIITIEYGTEEDWRVIKKNKNREALEALERIKKEAGFPYFSSLYDIDDWKRDFKIIEEALTSFNQTL